MRTLKNRLCTRVRLRDGHYAFLYSIWNRICDRRWSSAPATSSSHTAKSRPCEDGVSAWVPVVEAMRKDERRWLSPGSLGTESQVECPASHPGG
jgi:hypothetical protein